MCCRSSGLRAADAQTMESRPPMRSGSQDGLISSVCFRHTWGHGSRCIGRIPLGHLGRCRGIRADSAPVIARPAPRPRIVETVGAGASIRVLGLSPQVACRPFGRLRVRCTYFCPARGQRQCALMPMDLAAAIDQIGVPFAKTRR